MKVFLVINQDLFDGSAHALYCYRNCWWLAEQAPVRCTVELLYAGDALWHSRDESARAGRHFEFGPSSLRVLALPAWRKKKQHAGITLNAWFYRSVASYLKKHAQEGDVFVTASFPKLLRSLASRGKSGLHWLYEAHQLAELEDSPPQNKVLSERDALRNAEAFITTTDSLKMALERSFPGRMVTNLGLACGVPASVPAAPTMPPLRLGYVGSVYQGQGVDWLIRNWRQVREGLGKEGLELHIAGGSTQDLVKLREMADQHHAGAIRFWGRVPQAGLPEFLSSVNALIIPSLAEGRMPHVAITKAYDYLSYQRPVVASALPSITDVIRPGKEALAFEPGSVESLIQSLQCLLANEATRAGLVNAASLRAEELRWDKRAKSYWQYLSSLCHNQPASTAS